MAKRKVLGLGAVNFLAAAALLLAACGYNISYPRPVLNSISPMSAPAGSAGFTLTVSGRNFASGSSVVEWNGSPRTTVFVSGSQLQATINPSDLVLAGPVAVTVFTQSPGGGVSSPATFTITPVPSPVPTVTSISPVTAFAGGPSFTLTVNGTNFVNGSTVLWNGGNHATTFLNSTLLVAIVTGADIQTAGTAQVAVLNPLPGGGASNTVVLNVNNPVPQVVTFSPVIAAAGGAAFTLTVNGTGFACAKFTTSGSTTTCSTLASTVNWNGSPRTTTFVNTTQVTAPITAADIAAAEIVQVTVTNAAPGGGTSSPAGYPVIPGSNGAGLPELVDVSNNGVEAANGIGSVSGPGPATAGNGRFIVFASDSSNLVPNDFNGAADVFLRDTCLGMTSNCMPVTTLVSVSADGTTTGNGPSSEPSVSSNGRFVVFSSSATNLLSPSLASSTPQPQIYLRDTCTGATSCTPTTTLVSVAPDGKTPSDGASSPPANAQPAISSDGRFIAFTSTAGNLGPSNPGHSQEIFLRDTCQGAGSGCTASTILVSTPDGSTLANGASSQPTIGVASSGQFIAFSSTATNLAAGATGTQEIYRRTTCVGISSGCTASTILISTPDGTTLANGASGQVSISNDGRFVAFASLATNLGTSTGGFQQIYLRDTCTGAASGCSQATSLVSTSTSGMGGGADSQQPQLSTTGQFVVFSSAAPDLVSTGANSSKQVYARNTCAAAAGTCTPSTVLASVGAGGMPVGIGDSTAPAISGDGHFVVFLSQASNLVSNDTNTAPIRDVFLAISHF